MRILTPEGRRKLRSGLVIVPLIILGVDLVRTPVILNRCENTSEPTMRVLVEKQFEPMGTYLGHSFYMSLDSFLDSKPLNYLDQHATALVIAIDHSDPNVPIWGPLTRDVLEKLKALSPSDAEALHRVVIGQEPAPGKVVALDLGLAADQRESFPVGRLYILGIRSDASGTNRDKSLKDLKSGLDQIMALAARSNVGNLVVPSLGVDPSEPNTTLGFREVFPQVLHSALPASKPAKVYVSIFQDWPDGYRNNAFVALQEAWHDLCASREREPVFVHQRFRMMLLGSFVCLIVSSFYIPLSIRNFVVIAGSFLTLTYSGYNTITAVVGEYWSAGNLLFADLVMVGVIALAFPLLPRWNPKDIFESERK